MKKKLLSILLLVSIILGTLPTTLNISVKASNFKSQDALYTDNPYYKAYGEDYWLLFEKYPYYLYNESFENLINTYMTDCSNLINKYSNNANLGSFLYALDNNVKVLAKEVFASFGWTKSNQEQMRLDSINYFIQNFYKNEKTMSVIRHKIEQNFADINCSYSLDNNTENVEFIEELVEACGPDMPYSSIEEIANYICDSSSYKLDLFERGINITQYICALVQTHQAEVCMLEELQSIIDPASDMYSDLNLLIAELNKNPLDHLKEYFLDEYAHEIICGIIKTAASSKVPGDMASAIVSLSVSIFVNHIYKGALADDIVQTMLLYSYAGELRSKVDVMRLAFTQSSDKTTKEDIEEYEFAFSAYMAAVKIMLENAKTMETSDIAKSTYQNAIDALNDWLNYDGYIKLCLKNAKADMEKASVTDKMDLLLEKLGGSYFTVNQKACTDNRSKHINGKCDNCYLPYIVEAKWFKETFGTLSIEQFPMQDVSLNIERQRGGWSCFGFAGFAQHFIYSNSRMDIVNSERVANGTFNKNFIQNNVKPGDVIRIEGHSMVVYAIMDNGIKVLDSNWNLNNNLNCFVQLHTMPYTYSAWSGATVLVNRVTNVTSINTETDVDSNMPILESSQPTPSTTSTPLPVPQKGILDLSATSWKGYNVGLNAEMYADKAYTIYHDAPLEILRKCTNSKGNEIYYAYSPDLNMNCYVSAKYVKIIDTEPATIPIISSSVGWTKAENDKWYYINPNDGNILKGWFCSPESKLWYYLDTESGYMISSNWFCDPESGLWYYLDDNGAMCTGWIMVDNLWYYLDMNGSMCTGWNTIENNWYLFGANGAMLTGWQEVNGKYYYMTADGKCLVSTTTPDGYNVDKTGARIN